MININKIRLSGTTYNIQDLNATKTVELTQAEYDELSPKDPNVFYIITDATAGDLSNYYTKTETDGLLDTKLDVTAYTPTDLSNYYTKSETSGATEISTALASKADTATTYTKTETDNAITAATSTKQDTLVSGTNIKTINNQSILGEGNIQIQGGGGSSYTAGDGIDITNDVISVTGKVDTSTYNTYTAATDTALASKQTTLTAGNGISIVDNVISATGGGGSGKAVSAGTNISITTGETADTINCTLPITATTDTTNKAIIIGQSITSNNTKNGCVIIGSDAKGTLKDVIIGTKAKNAEGWNDVVAIGNEAKGYSECIAIGSYTETYRGYKEGSVAIGYYAKAKNMANAVAIGHNVSTTGKTKTNINNQIKIDTSNQVYIYNKDNTEMICLQDQLGGGGTVDTEITSASTNPVTSAAIYNQFGGLKLVKLTKSEYSAMEQAGTLDNSTLYIVIGS